ncbi:MAG: 50S ribosomal protein L30 [Bdellovibrionales bacterium RIFCSPHIGHO2_01_FULL_40_29]|nr:MAG: 50S ribosomal protein L30 [Bdellovibrionales bacterium RIFCSPHIGHO2_01_FULL_40_29]OFZ33903.1 MAG: 50S ribosomal protein L30 [Bdellovibrionales bacterium RIFCSPHIGHO2_02_FULL_40_15]
MAKAFVVKLKRSTISCSESQIKTVHALGLRKINNTVEVADNAANRGQLSKVQHLLEITIKK